MGGNAVQNCSVKPVQETQTETRLQGLRSSCIHQGEFFVVLAWSESEVCNAALGHLVVLHFRLWLWTLIGGSSPRLTACQGWKAQSTHRWLGMHRPLTLFSSPAEAVCRGVATVIPNSFLGARSESRVLGEDLCPCPSQGMMLSGLQRYYLSPDTLYTLGWVKLWIT